MTWCHLLVRSTIEFYGAVHMPKRQTLRVASIHAPHLNMIEGL